MRYRLQRLKQNVFAVVFGLVGLYLHVEKKYSGREVQKVHMQLGRVKRELPSVSLPLERGAINVSDVLAKPEGSERDEAITIWCQSVWTAFAASRQVIVDFLRDHGIN